MKSLRWKAFLPITHKARPKKADIEWFKRVGVSTEQLTLALSVLHHVRQDVAKLLHNDDRNIMHFMMLVHDHSSGAPTKSKNVPHIDLTLCFDDTTDARKFIRKPWRFVAPAQEPTAIAGVDLAALGGIHQAERLIRRQSAWYLDLITSYASSISDIALLKQIGQFLHFFANMSQLVIV